MKKVVPGESILPALTASWYNQTLPQKGHVGKGASSFHGEMTFRVYLEGGSDIPRFNAVGLSSKIGNDITTNFKVNSSSTNKYNWVVVQGELNEAAEVQPAVYFGTTFANVTIRDVNHRYVNWIDNKLQSDNEGRGQILIGAGTGDHLIYINIGNYASPGGTNLFAFETISSVSGPTFSGEVFELNGASFGSSLGSHTIYDPAGWFLGGEAETPGLCLLQDEKYYAIQAACPEEGSSE